jgi:ribonuclease HI
MTPEASDRDLPRGIASAPEGPVRVHFDGARELVEGRAVAAYGFTIEGAGLYHEDFGLAVPPGHDRATNNVAEYAGAICALEWLVRHGYRGEVEVAGDSQLVVRQMTGEYAVRAEHLEPYHERLRQLGSLFRAIRFLWVPREENRRADALSKLGIAGAGPSSSQSASGPDAPASSRRPAEGA